MIAASRCDENIDFLEYFRDQLQENLHLLRLEWLKSSTLYPYVMMLYNQLICIDEDYAEFEALSSHLAKDILANSDLATKTVNAEFVSYQQNMFRDQFWFSPSVILLFD